ncbi:MAG: squalene/phytoene synthase family protein [Myxococcales bacterium]|nr:squalene/phytoene synthase family protein [Myxococcales bacterium]
MQLTNIVRDVAEDADKGRVYLPVTRLRARGIEPQQVLGRTADRADLAGIVLDLVSMAEAYYRSANRGMHFIPWRPRTAIFVASRVYREIGLSVARKWGRGRDARAARRPGLPKGARDGGCPFESRLARCPEPNAPFACGGAPSRSRRAPGQRCSEDAGARSLT